MLHREVRDLPEELDLTPLARAEMARVPEVDRKIFIRRSERMWVLHDEANTTLLVAGISNPTLTSTPELWILMCADFKTRLRRNLAEIKTKLDELLALYNHVKVRVDADSPAGQKFVRYLGFNEYYRDTHGAREYIYYEVRR